jgi:hypothetical protein
LGHRSGLSLDMFPLPRGGQVLAPRDQNLALESILRQPRPWLLSAHPAG